MWWSLETLRLTTFGRRSGQGFSTRMAMSISEIQIVDLHRAALLRNSKPRCEAKSFIVGTYGVGSVDGQFKRSGVVALVELADVVELGGPSAHNLRSSDLWSSLSTRVFDADGDTIYGMAKCACSA